MANAKRPMHSRLFDPFLAALLAILAVGILAPVPLSAANTLAVLGTASVVLLFFLYGMRLPTAEVWAGLRNFRLQSAVLTTTFLAFPLLGWALTPLWASFLGEQFATGLLYLTLLPSTVQSSIAFTSLARGNIAGAVCAATVSNTLGMLLTPLLVLLLMGQRVGMEPATIRNVVLTLLFPFFVGQLIQPKLGTWVRARPGLTRVVDRGTILLVVTAGVVGATARGLWKEITWGSALGLLVASGVLLTLMLALTWWGGRLLGLNRPDRIALLMAGSKKSLATGLPMAQLIFPAATVAAVTVPVIIFHQLQLVVCAQLARVLARHSAAPED